MVEAEGCCTAVVEAEGCCVSPDFEAQAETPMAKVETTSARRPKVETLSEAKMVNLLEDTETLANDKTLAQLVVEAQLSPLEDSSIVQSWQPSFS